ncbi:methyltransferase [Laspinema sp. D1]|uniref:site-specific DNA-methyltransferase (cytosine-N(4)-specific) n=1 Tax=Laspinema palackyanum D2a TaxID=2953684 RepID=A0ABT2N275_9CYAN|nr:methyltransferase [Laspinema sp. D2a]
MFRDLPLAIAFCSFNVTAMSTFFANRLRNKFSASVVQEFNQSISQHLLDIEDKRRTNLFTWRGQFSPQLVENLLLAYCPRDATVLDPFCGSGTVLYECGYLGLEAVGFELNPAAWILSRIYEFINLTLGDRNQVITSVSGKLQQQFPQPELFQPLECDRLEVTAFRTCLLPIYWDLTPLEQAILDALVILLDLDNQQPIHIPEIHTVFLAICQWIRDFPESENSLKSYLGDARNLSIATDTIDFVLTSPPYINVFNYHQNYRNSVEFLNWNLLEIAKSEIGSNRANRKNRFFTVIQYCLDLALIFKEIKRVCKPGARIIFVVGYESTVLGVPFYNAKIISELATLGDQFELVLTQKRQFKNKFGKMIREDLLHLVNGNTTLSEGDWEVGVRQVAEAALRNGLEQVSEKNKGALLEAISKVLDIGRSPLYFRQPTPKNSFIK